MKRIAVVGLGQIGGSLALALRNASAKTYLIGIDPSMKRRKLLKKYLNESSAAWSRSTDADLIFVCMHFQILQKFLNEVKTAALIVDVCSSKELIVNLANRKRLRMIGGHPMAGNEHKGEKGWNLQLFHNAPFFLCPAGTSSPSDRIQLIQLLKKIGALPRVVDPAQHDRAVAITSHLPAFIANSYANLAKGLPAYFQGPGFKSFTRPGKCSPELLQTFRLSNRKNIQTIAAKFQHELLRFI
jgi:prephenate dehydrogenase